MATAERPLRRDAERNRERLLAAARLLFAERGLDVSMDDIADRAGGGVGTAYRRFRNRDELIDALFEDRMAQFVALAEEALGEPDPWGALTGFLERSIAMQAADRGFKELVVGHHSACDRVATVRERMLPLVRRLVERARDAGELRADVSELDVPLFSVMLGSVADFAHDTEPELWRRYLTLVLDGLRARPAPTTALTPAPLNVAQLDSAMTAWRPSRR